jgi:hypothetical protein
MRSLRRPNEDLDLPGGARICWAGLADPATAEDILVTIVKLCIKYRLRMQVRGQNKSMAIKSVERSSMAAAADAGTCRCERGPAFLNAILMALEKLTTISEPFRLHPSAGVTSNVLEA